MPTAKRSTPSVEKKAKAKAAVKKAAPAPKAKKAAKPNDREFRVPFDAWEHARVYGGDVMEQFCATHKIAKVAHAAVLKDGQVAIWGPPA